MNKDSVILNFLDSHFVYDNKTINIREAYISEDIIKECISDVIDLLSDYLHYGNANISKIDIGNILISTLGNIELSIDKKIVFMDYLITESQLEELLQNIYYYFEDIKTPCKILM